MEIIFLLLRLPFFLIGFLLLSLVVVVIGGLAVVVWYGLLFPSWLVIGIPFTIISSTFSNEHKFSGYMVGLREVFWDMPTDTIIAVACRYESLFIWLLKGGAP